MRVRDKFSLIKTALMTLVPGSLVIGSMALKFAGAQLVIDKSKAEQYQMIFRISRHLEFSGSYSLILAQIVRVIALYNHTDG